MSQRVDAEVPDLAPLVSALMKQVDKQNWQQWLVIVLAVLQVLVGYLQWQKSADEQPSLSPNQVERITEEVYRDLQTNPRKTAPAVATPTS